MADPAELNDYAQLMDAWFDELTPVVDAFKRSFPTSAEGFLKYMFALHMMESAVCYDMEIPLAIFHDVVASATAAWCAAGKPSNLHIHGKRITAPPVGSKPN